VIAVKLDEDLPNDLVEVLRSGGMDVTSVRLQGWTGWKDEKLLPEIQQEGRWLFTADKGFSDIRRYPPGTHAGIVFFRADRESRAAYCELAKILMQQLDLTTTPGALVVVTPRSVRIVRGHD